MTIASIVLMLITSAGAFGFLSAEFQKAIAGTNSQNVMLQAIEGEQGRLQKRKEEIDRQIAQLPDNNVRGRTQLIRQFGPEVSRLNARLVEIDKELPKLKVDAIKKNVEVGPITYIAQAFNTTPEKAVVWVILIIIFVFDPLAIALLLAGNFLLEQNRNKGVVKPVVEDSPTDEPLFEVMHPTPSPAPEVVAEVAKVEEVIEKVEEPYQEITVGAPAAFYKSALHDIDVRRSDVETDMVTSSAGKLKNMYSKSDTAKEPTKR